MSSNNVYANIVGPGYPTKKINAATPIPTTEVSRSQITENIRSLN